MRLIPAVLIAALVLGACSGIGSTGKSLSERAGLATIWVSERFAESSSVEAEPLEPFEATIEPRLIWRGRIDGEQDGYPKLQPVILGDRIFSVAKNRRRVSAQQVGSGQRLWNTTVATPISGGLGGGSGMILAGTGEAQLIALSAESGEQIWQARVSSEVLAAPQVRGGVVVVSTADGQLFGFSAADGRELWSVERDVPSLSLRGSAPPTLTANLAIQGFANGRLTAVGLRTGFEAWDVALAIPRGRTVLDRLVDADGAAVLSEDEDRVYTAAFQGRLAAVEVDTGEVDWGRDLSSYQGLALNSYNVFATDVDGVVWSFDQNTGGLYWNQGDLRHRGVTAPAVIDGHVVVGDADGYLHFLSDVSGKFAARLRLSESPIRLQPMKVGDLLYVVHADGTVAALKP